jgi:hypothetical protein
MADLDETNSGGLRPQPDGQSSALKADLRHIRLLLALYGRTKGILLARELIHQT